MGCRPAPWHIPGPPGSLVDTDVNVGGPIARSVEDLRLALDVVAGPGEQEAVAWRLDLPDRDPPAALAGLRIGVTFDDPAYPVAAEVQEVLRRLVGSLVDAGARVEEGALPVPMVDAVDSWFALVLPIIGAGLPDELYQAFTGVVAVPGDMASTSLSRLAGRFRDRLRADQRRQAQRARWAERFESVDAWLAPCLAVPAFEHDHRPLPQRDLLIDGRTVPALDLTAWPGAIGAMLLPSVAIPAGQTTDGLPVGVQVIGPYLQDRRLLRIAALIDEAGPGFASPPIG